MKKYKLIALSLVGTIYVAGSVLIYSKSLFQNLLSQSPGEQNKIDRIGSFKELFLEPTDFWLRIFTGSSINPYTLWSIRRRRTMDELKNDPDFNDLIDINREAGMGHHAVHAVDQHEKEEKLNL